uniref:Uncharacterized protein n=1 Tax=Anguilla anguilla TaxID=7936 RepID=A0A0E9UYZ6_ANGAN
MGVGFNASNQKFVSYKCVAFLGSLPVAVSLNSMTTN